MGIRRIVRRQNRRGGSLRGSCLAAALAVSAISCRSEAVAQSLPEATSARLKYVYYKDRQPSAEDRMTVRSPMFWIDAPLPGNIEVEGSAVLDSVSGASPLYLDTLSGASGIGLEDDRRAGDLKFTRYFDDFSIGLGGAYSSEHDYTSRAGAIDGRVWNSDKTTVGSFGIGADFDSISSSNDPTLDESRHTFRLLVGVTHLINEVSVLQSNVTYSSGDGYYTDPYKVFDDRPRSREDWAWLTRYNLFIREIESALHIDYRFFFNTWGNTAQTVELQLYKTFGVVTLRPNIRFYSQTAASFFIPEAPPMGDPTFVSADQRLSAFGGISGGLKAIVKLGSSFEVDALYQYMRQSDALALGSSEPDTMSLYAHYVEVGVLAKF